MDVSGTKMIHPESVITMTNKGKCFGKVINANAGNDCLERRQLLFTGTTIG